VFATIVGRVMRVHVITHVPFEGPAAVGSWALSRGHHLAEIAAITEEYPDPSVVDLLVVMGGPMDADDEVASPWLSAEKRFIAAALARGASVVGVCLGSQILAEVLGGRVKRNPAREIGWREVRLTDAGRRAPLLSGWPDAFVAGHWHGDTFDLPPAAECLASSDACANQLFVAEAGRAVGIQFHLEWDERGLSELAGACHDELVDGGDRVDSAEALLRGVVEHGGNCRELLYLLLDDVAGNIHKAVSGT
jgi:GMP synthase-like glutamine amidotransferase